MVLSDKERRAKLEKLAESEGYENVEAMLRRAAFDSVSPGICVRPGCSYAIDVEPDQQEGYCELCREQSVQSALILAELI
jgi:hypothetical protein